MDPMMVDLIKAGLWPLVVLVAMLVFVKPLSGLIDRVTRISVKDKDGATYEITAEKRTESPSPDKTEAAPGATTPTAEVAAPMAPVDASDEQNPIRNWLILAITIAGLLLTTLAMGGTSPYYPLQYFIWMPILAAATGAIYLTLEQFGYIPWAQPGAAETSPGVPVSPAWAYFRDHGGLFIAVFIGGAAGWLWASERAYNIRAQERTQSLLIREVDKK